MPPIPETAGERLISYGALGVFAIVSMIFLWYGSRAIWDQFVATKDKILDQWIKTQETDRTARTQAAVAIDRVVAAIDRMIAMHADHLLADERRHALDLAHQTEVERRTGDTIEALERRMHALIDALAGENRHAIKGMHAALDGVAIELGIMLKLIRRAGEDSGDIEPASEDTSDVDIENDDPDGGRE